MVKGLPYKHENLSFDPQDHVFKRWQHVPITELWQEEDKQIAEANWSNNLGKMISSRFTWEGQKVGVAF